MDWATVLPKAMLFVVQREQFLIKLSKTLLLWVYW